MDSVNAGTARFEEVEILGIPALFTTLRVDRATVPKGMYAYDMRTRRTGASPACWHGVSWWSISGQCSPPAPSTCRRRGIWTYPPAILRSRASVN